MQLHRLNNCTIIFLTFVALPAILFVLYNILGLDAGGGFWEENEIGVKMLLAAVAFVGSGSIFVRNAFFPPKEANSPRHLIWLVVAIICLCISSLALAIVWGFRHGIGF